MKAAATGTSGFDLTAAAQGRKIGKGGPRNGSEVTAAPHHSIPEDQERGKGDMDQGQERGTKEIIHFYDGARGEPRGDNYLEVARTRKRSAIDMQECTMHKRR